MGLAMMFTQPIDSIARFSPRPFLPWLAPPLLLIAGIEHYRAEYWQALAKRFGNQDVARAWRCPLCVGRGRL